MGIFIRVVKGNAEQAFRHWNKVMSSDPSSKFVRGRPFNEKPTVRNRREKTERIRRANNTKLFANLHVILARKARGF